MQDGTQRNQYRGITSANGQGWKARLKCGELAGSQRIIAGIHELAPVAARLYDQAVADMVFQGRFPPARLLERNFTEGQWQQVTGMLPHAWQQCNASVSTMQQPSGFVLQVTEHLQLEVSNYQRASADQVQKSECRMSQCD